jgi:hypothetical protein
LTGFSKLLIFDEFTTKEMEPQSDAFHPQDIEQSRPSQACTADMPDEKERNLVDWDGPNDPKNPHNWPNWKKALCTISMGTLNFCVTFSSSVMTSTVKPLSELFDVSETVATLATSLFVLVSFHHIHGGPSLCHHPADEMEYRGLLLGP